MSKYIDREELINKLLEKCNDFRDREMFGSERFIKHNALAVVDEMPTADVVEVVRCGECIHWNAETKGCKRNPSVYRWYAKDFCSNGVR